MFRQPQSRQRKRGAVLIEISLIIPFLLLVLTAVVNLASIIWQIQVVTEAAKTAVRKATNLSNDGVTCAQVEGEVRQVFNEYTTTYGRSMGIVLSSAWTTPAVCFNTAYYDGYQRTLIRASVSTQGEKNCVLCMLNLLNYIPINISRSFALEWGCSGSYTSCY